MFRARNFVAVILFLQCFALGAQNIGVGQWRVHLPFRDPQGFLFAGDNVYVWAEQGLYRYNQPSGEIKILSKIEGYADIGVSDMVYDEERKTLVIAYKNAKIDLLTDQKDLQYVPDIYQNNSITDRSINSLKLYQNYVLIAGGFGVLVYDLEKREFSATWSSTAFLNTPVQDVAVAGQNAYIATEDGVFTAPMPASGVSINPTAWQSSVTGYANKLGMSNGELYGVIDSGLFHFSNGGWQQVEQKDDYRSLENDQGNLFVSTDSGYYKINGTQRPFTVLEGSRQALERDNVIWYASEGFGLIRKQNGQLEFLSPSGPYGLVTGKMVSKGSKLYVAGGFMSERGGVTYTPNGYYIFEDGNWDNSKNKNIPYLDTMNDLHAITLDPNGGDVWVAGLYQGIARVREQSILEFYDESNSPIGLTVTQIVVGLAMDEDRNLWVANFESPTPLLVKNTAGQWDSFSVGNSTSVLDLMIARDGSKWMRKRDLGSVSAGIVVYNDNQTPFDKSDDQILDLNSNNSGIPDNEVNCLTMDRNGQIWVGTARGLAVFYSPSSLFTNNPSMARQIVVGEGDDIGYLLGDEEINAILVDGGNRKWIASRSGLWLVSPDGQEILAHFNEDNSPLLSNEIRQLGMVESTGELFIATDKGIISYRTGSSEGGDKHADVKVFPNPVRPGYTGEISISGLPTDAYVKITDIAGNLIYETRANGGTATWNGNNFSGRRAASGVYLVFSGNKDASDTFVSKILIVNE